MMHPEIPPFGLANYRSFGMDGFVLHDLGKINILIGKNNAGKSNVLRAVQIMSRLQSPTDGPRLFDKLADGHRRSSNPTLITFTLPPKSLVNHEYTPNAFVGEVQKALSRPMSVQWDADSGGITKCDILESMDVRGLHWLMGELTKSQFGELQASQKPYLEKIGAYVVEKAIKEAKKFFKEPLIIPVFREVRHVDTTASSGEDFNGLNIIELLREMQHPNIGEESKEEVFKTIQNFARELVGTTDLILEVPARENRLYIRMHGNRLPLENYGTGIHHLVILCSALAMNTNKVVTIEEPEIHLHPELQRKFLRFIATQTANTYFISTHSNIFLDSPTESSVYHVSYDGVSSKLERTKTTEKTRAILSDMAYKASDLLQANGVVWVEGPSDRVYLNRWLNLVSPELVEGIHYGIAFYGGKVLAHFTATDDPVDDLVEVLRINRHAVVCMDRDGDDESTKLNKSKERVLRELQDGFCWVTRGREVENYLPAGLIDRFLAERFKAPSPFRCGADGQFARAFEKQTKALGRPLFYGRDKVGYARELCRLMTLEDLNVLDLTFRLGQLISHIRKWNHIETPAATI